MWPRPVAHLTAFATSFFDVARRLLCARKARTNAIIFANATEEDARRKRIERGRPASRSVFSETMVTSDDIQRTPLPDVLEA
eukprot:EC684651.1.p3 GENE.EC684651.1~~EC684651.1.p3  ORF type:complete len:82 (-),score=8.35 EC684651.1:49-294(-)